MDIMERNGSAEVVRTPEVGLTRKDVADLDIIRRSPERLRELGTGKAESDTALVHAVFEEGMRAIKERNMIDAYEALAQDLRAGDGRSELEGNKARLKNRRRDRWDD